MGTTLKNIKMFFNESVGMGSGGRGTVVSVLFALFVKAKKCIGYEKRYNSLLVITQSLPFRTK